MMICWWWLSGVTPLSCSFTLWCLTRSCIAILTYICLQYVMVLQKSSCLLLVTFFTSLTHLNPNPAAGCLHTCLFCLPGFLSQLVKWFVVKLLSLLFWYTFSLNFVVQCANLLALTSCFIICLCLAFTSCYFWHVLLSCLHFIFAFICCGSWCNIMVKCYWSFIRLPYLTRLFKNKFLFIHL